MSIVLVRRRIDIQQIKIGNSFIPIFIVFKKHSCIQRNKISTFNYAENKTQKAHEMCRFVHLALGVFLFPFVSWVMSTSDLETHHGNILQLLHSITQGPPLTSLVSKAIRRTGEPWELRGDKEKCFQFPKDLQNQRSTSSTMGNVFKVEHIEYLIKQTFVPCFDSCSKHKKLDSKDGWNDSKTSPPSGFFLRIQKAQPQKMQVFFLQMVEWNSCPTSFMLAIFHWAMLASWRYRLFSWEPLVFQMWGLPSKII